MGQDVSSIRALYLRQRDALVRFLIQRTRDPALAEDIAQETWLRIDRSGTVSALHNPSGYLFRIAGNLAIDYLRLQNRHKLSPLEIEAVLHIDEPSPEQTAIDRSELRLLVDVIAGLPVRQRQSLLMRRLENKPHSVIADHFGVSTRTVELELRRALTACHALRKN
jgi:RNA polymerase sigma-70 factor (ECF subfamily)